jgi:YD repeat-containing protein
MGYPNTITREPCTSGDCDDNSSPSSSSSCANDSSCQSSTAATAGSSTVFMHFKAVDYGYTSYRARSGCFSIPLKHGGSLSLTWNQFPGVNTGLFPVIGDGPYSGWETGGRGGMFTFLPYRALTSTPPTTQVTASDKGFTQYTDVGVIGTITYYEVDNNLPLRGRSNSATIYFTEYQLDTGTVCIYGDLSHPLDGRPLCRIDRNGNVLNYVYGARNPNPNSLKPILRKITGDLTSVIPYFQYADETGPAPIGKIFLLDTANPANSRSMYFAYQDPTTDANCFLQSIVYPNGCTMGYGLMANGGSYNGHTGILKEQDSGGFTTYFNYTYVGGGQICKVVEPLGRTTYFNYGTLLTAVVPIGRLGTYYAYDLSTDYSNSSQLRRKIDAYGNVTYYDWDQTLNRIRRQTAANGSITYYDHNPLGFIARQVRAANNSATASVNDPTGVLLHATVGPRFVPTTFPEVTYYNYNGLHNRTSIMRPLGFVTYFVPDTSGRIRKQVDARGGSTYFNFNASTGFNQSVVDAGANVTYYRFDSFGNVTAGVSPRWREGGGFAPWTTYHAYDQRNNQYKSVDPLGRVTYFDYTSREDLLAVIDPLGVVTQSSYNPLRLLTKRTVMAAAVLVEKSYFTYDVYKNRIGAIDGNNHATYFGYDQLDRLTVVVDALNNRTLNAYDTVGNLVKSRNARGNTTYFNYDLLSREVAICDALGNQSYFVYDVGDFLIKQRDPRGFSILQSFDPASRQVSSTDPLLHLTYFGYDQNDNPVLVRDALGHATTTTYDSLNRPVLVTDALSNRTYFGFDAAGNRVKVRDARANTTLTAFDVRNLRHAVVDALGNKAYYGYDAVGNPVKFRDARANTTYYRFDAKRREISLTDAAGGIAYYAYDLVGNRIKTRDKRGNSTTTSFDAINRASVVTNALAGQAYFGYDAVGNQVKYRDQRSLTTLTSFDVLDRPLQISDPLVQTTYFGYDQNGNQVRVRDKRGNSVVAAYDALNRPLTYTNALEGQIYFGYDAVGNQVKARDPRGNSTTTAFDALHRPVVVSDPLGDATYFGYDQVGNRVKVRNAISASTVATYDANNRLSTTVDPFNGLTYYGYDQVGNLVKLRDARANTAFATFDVLNRRIQRTDALGDATYYGYDAVGNRVKVRDARANSAITTFDNLNRPSLATDALANTTYFGYDPVGNVVVARNGLAHANQWVFDALSRPYLATNGANQTSYFGYDPNGNMVKSRNPLGNATLGTYDVLNRLVKLTNPLNQNVQFSYDQNGNRVKEVDGLLHATYFSYDAINRLCGMSDPLGHRSYFIYDALSNLTQSVVYDPSIVPDQIAYDALGRMCKAIDIPSSQFYGYGTQAYGTTPYGGASLYQFNYFSYDAVGNLTTVVDEDGTKITGYDVVNRPCKRQYPRIGTAYFSYDQVSNRIAVTYPGVAVQAKYGYDAINRMTRLLSPDSYSAYFSYDRASNLIKTRFGNGSTCYYVYDNAERVMGILHYTSGGVPIVTMNYQRDVAGRIVKIARETDLAIYYGYDTADRLTKELWAKRSTSAQIYAFCYQYDNAGNRQYHWRFGAPNAVTEKAYFTYNAANALTKRWVAPTNVATYYAYNAAGNVVSWLEGVKATYFAYAPNGFINAITPPSTDGLPWQFAYDGLLNRVRILQGATPVYYAWDGMNELEELNTNGTLIARFTHGPALVPGIRSVMEVRRQTATTTYFQYLHMDHQGSVKAVTNSAGVVQLSYAVDCFGRQVSPPGGSSPTVPNNLVFQGNWLTVTIGTHAYGLSPSRVFDFTLGRFLQTDQMQKVAKLLNGSRGNAIGRYANTKFEPEMRYQAQRPHYVSQYGPDHLVNALDASGYDGGDGTTGWQGCNDTPPPPPPPEVSGPIMTYVQKHLPDWIQKGLDSLWNKLADAAKRDGAKPEWIDAAHDHWLSDVAPQIKEQVLDGDAVHELEDYLNGTQLKVDLDNIMSMAQPTQDWLKNHPIAEGGLILFGSVGAIEAASHFDHIPTLKKTFKKDWTKYADLDKLEGYVTVGAQSGAVVTGAGVNFGNGPLSGSLGGTANVPTQDLVPNSPMNKPGNNQAGVELQFKIVISSDDFHGNLGFDLKCEKTYGKGNIDVSGSLNLKLIFGGKQP